MNTTQEFRHERLKLSGNFMRLLQIQGGTKKDVISLRITQYAVHRRPAYAAISYTWGPNPKHIRSTNTSSSSASSTTPSDPYTRLIRVNGRPFRVRVNLWNLLYHLRQRGESRFLWVDALCIDQENLEERNFHVQRMSKIYENSQKTFVWLGLPSDDRRQARVLEFVHEMALFCRKGHGSVEMGQRIFREKYLNEGLSQRWMNMLELCRGTYWTRTWIIQEFVQASNLEVMCGMASLDWKDFEDAVRMIRAIIALPPTAGPPLPAFIQQFIHTIPFRLTSRRIAHTASTLEELLSEFYDSRCAERRDKVYGILGIADDCRPNKETPENGVPGGTVSPPVYYGGGLLQPDYSKHILEVYFEVFSYLMQTQQTQHPPQQPRKKSPMQAIFLAQRALGITQADVESYTALLEIKYGAVGGDGNVQMTQRLAELSSPLIPDYVQPIDEVLPGWTSIRDLRQRLEQNVDWAKYVGHEVRRKGSSRPSVGTPRGSSTSTASTGSGTEYIRAPLPGDLIANVIQAASNSEEISHLYNYPSSCQPSSGGGGCTIPISHVFQDQHDKRIYNNPSFMKPSIIIESNPTLGVDPARAGFACTDVRPGDLLCQFSGLNLTLIARRMGSGHTLALVGLAKMCTHSNLNEQMGVHPSCKKHDDGTNWSDVPYAEGENGNPDGWMLITDPISLWEVLRRC